MGKFARSHRLNAAEYCYDVTVDGTKSCNLEVKNCIKSDPGTAGTS